jgi:hypothetical protein
MKIYLSGPVSPLTYAEAVRRFNAVRDIIVKEGHHEAVCPLDYTADLVGLPDEWEASMARVVPLLEGCGAILMLRGWEGSRGAKVELAKALGMGLEVIVE